MQKLQMELSVKLVLGVKFVFQSHFQVIIVFSSYTNISACYSISKFCLDCHRKVPLLVMLLLYTIAVVGSFCVL